MSKRKMRKKETETTDLSGDEKEEETETEDIYDDEQREEMLGEDEITTAESAFMEGRDMTVGKKKKDLGSEHEDTTSVELAKEEYEED